MKITTGLVLGAFVATLNANAALIVPAAAETQMGANSIQTSGYFRPGAQYFYGAEHFSGPVVINGFSFRMAVGSGLEGNTGVQNFQVSLSTTSATATGLNIVTPALNHGGDLTLVRNSPLDILSVGILNGDGVTDWAPSINFDTPFVYDPADGNLLMEFGGTMPNGIFTTRFIDGWEVDGAGLARVTPLTGGFISDQLGIVALFDTTPIPEPGSLLFLSFAAGLGLGRRRR